MAAAVFPEKFHTTEQPVGFVIGVMTGSGWRWFCRFGDVSRVLTAWCLAGAKVMNIMEASVVAQHLQGLGKKIVAMSCDRAMEIQKQAWLMDHGLWCDTMNRPKEGCGCPDCGSSLIPDDVEVIPPYAVVPPVCIDGEDDELPF